MFGRSSFSRSHQSDPPHLTPEQLTAGESATRRYTADRRQTREQLDLQHEILCSSPWYA
jgi:hypothetical protein